MCFGGGGGGGPTGEDQKAAAQDRVDTESAAQVDIKKRAEDKRDDISDAISRRSSGAGRSGSSGGYGRRSLIQSGTGSGFVGRFD